MSILVTTVYPINISELNNFRHANKLYNYWKTLNAERKIPLRSAFRPQLITNLLPFIMILEKTDTPDDVIFRIIGTAIENILGELSSGASLSTINPYDDAHDIQKHALNVLATQEPVFFESALSAKANLPLPDYAMIMLPLSSNGEKCDLVLALFDFKSSIKDED